ncbi:GNAT family N-acetyltransferase [Auraticoccus sp. F435]|uniref:GNAT family N-acetyltransferase n=1 Tax=Auraticoccus cholistanensis TaxID=2656650 RepID=A0A6A9UQT3_9ACTN|nr:GNAT family N-acetyltransferase [Auraticoccus cholistanensis]MVA75103.1 GNAT family N-acetyltransferase [Auraticoccus cholistanensis]
MIEVPPTVQNDDVTGRIHSVAGDITLARARREHLPGLVRLLSDDEIGATREVTADDLAYARAFAAVDADPQQVLVVGLLAEEPVAMLQISFIPGLSRRGALRAQLEGIRVAEPLRGTGVGTALMQWVIDYCRDHGATLVQLTTDRRRDEAHEFYARFGFVDSHLGLKLEL